MPKVSVITRTRNRPQLLKRAVASVSAQTFQDYEHIIVNDAGDRSPVEEVVAHVDPAAREKIRILHREVSTGMEAASNAAFDTAQGEFVAIHDDDDSWSPLFLERTVEYLEANPACVGVATRCEVVYEVLDDEGRPTETGRELLATDKSAWTLIDTLAASYSPPIAQLVRRSVAQAIGRWDESMKTQGDWDFSIRLLSQGPAGFLDGDPLSFWHHRIDATGHAGNSIYTDPQDHVNANMRVRDRYLRTTISTDIPEVPDLGSSLQAAEYYRRLSIKLRQENDALHQALQSVHADISRQADEHRVKLDEILTSLDVAHQALGSILQTTNHVDAEMNSSLVRRIKRRIGR